MQVVADPNQLRYTASLFSNGANELRQKAKRLEDIQNGLVQGQNSWKGEGAQGFSTTMEKIQYEIQQKAGILEEAAQILIRFAHQMDYVNQIRNQASSLERTLWSISGDSEAAFHERQSISYQINQLQQEAEWQANAADAQATSALNSLSIPMPDFQAGSNYATSSLEEELEGLSATEKSYYRRHSDLILGFENDSESEGQSLDRATLTAVLIQYLKSKEEGYLSDDYKQKAATQDFNMLYGDLSDDELAATIQNIFDSEKQANHFQQEIQSGNYDQNAIIHENGYTQYALNQAYQQEPLGGMHGVLLGMGLVGALGGGNGSGITESYGTLEESEDQTSSPPKEITNEGSSQTNQVTEEKGNRPYSNISDSKSIGPGKKFTSAQKKKIIEENMKRNGGKITSDLSGEELVPAQKSQKGVAPPPNEVQVDHIDPRSKGGTNSYSNAQILSRQENREKWDK